LVELLIIDDVVSEGAPRRGTTPDDTDASVADSNELTVVIDDLLSCRCAIAANKETGRPDLGVTSLGAGTPGGQHATHAAERKVTQAFATRKPNSFSDVPCPMLC
jgi:hypothetical protein